MRSGDGDPARTVNESRTRQLRMGRAVRTADAALGTDGKKMAINVPLPRVGLYRAIGPKRNVRTRFWRARPKTDD